MIKTQLQFKAEVETSMPFHYGSKSKHGDIQYKSQVKIDKLAPVCCFHKSVSHKILHSIEPSKLT
jgi:hypothetical protein